MKCKVLFLASFLLITVVAKCSLCAGGEAEMAAGTEGCRAKGAQKFQGWDRPWGKKDLGTHRTEDKGQRSRFVPGMR